MTLLRIFVSGLAGAIALAVMVPAARAGTYDVAACKAIAGGANHSWTYETNDTSHVQGPVDCESTTGNYRGLQARTVLGSAGAPVGTYGQWVLRAPAGTSISRIQISRMLGTENGSGWRLYGRQGDGSIISGETCMPTPDSYDCTVTGDLDRDLNTDSIAYGVECPGPTYGCTTGATIHAARAAIYSARVTITDPTNPTVGAPTGALVSGTGYHRGTEAATFNGSDGQSGLKALRVYVDGVKRAESELTCDYTYVVPCSNPTDPTSLSVNLGATSGATRLIHDGAHTVQVAAVDAADNETRSSAVPLVVDTTAPAAPTALTTSSAGAWQTTPTFDATWTNPTGQLAPITTAHWTLCPAGSSTGCVSGEEAISGTTLTGLALPAEGGWNLAVALEDAAGNVDPANVATTVLRYDATPQTVEDLRVDPRGDGNPSVYARWAVGGPVISLLDRAEWTLCPQGSTSGCQSGTTDAELGLALQAPAEGVWELSVRIVDQAGNAGPPATTAFRYTAPATAPPTTPVQPPSRAAARLRLASATLSRRSRLLTVKGNVARAATGRVRLTVTVGRGARARTRTIHATIRRGRFAGVLRLSRRDLRRRLSVAARYGGSATYRPSMSSRRVAVLR